MERVTGTHTNKNANIQIHIHCFAGNWIGCFSLLVLGADPLFSFDRFKTRLLQLRCESAGNDDNLFLGGTFQLS